ncbi:MAG: hypothetical protein ACR2QW_15865 [bacterium]
MNLINRQLKVCLYVLLLVIATGCASDSGYQPYPPGEELGLYTGYKDQYLGENKFNVQYTYTKKRSLGRLLSRRARELCAGIGFSNFNRIGDEELEQWVVTYDSPLFYKLTQDIECIP